jgi:hypothetical protein
VISSAKANATTAVDHSLPPLQLPNTNTNNNNYYFYYYYYNYQYYCSNNIRPPPFPAPIIMPKTRSSGRNSANKHSAITLFDDSSTDSPSQPPKNKKQKGRPKKDKEKDLLDNPVDVRI